MSCIAPARPQQEEYEKCVPQCIDFAAHILRILEAQYQLVSRSGVIRVDLAAEFKHCAPGQSEEDLVKLQKLPHQWQTTGAGFIVRFFFDEVSATHPSFSRSALRKSLSLTN